MRTSAESKDLLLHFVSRAEAQVDSIGLVAGDKSPAYRTNEFFRSLFSRYKHPDAP
jgi:hypothetical protein